MVQNMMKWQLVSDTSDAFDECDVLGKDGDSLGMNGNEVGVLEDAYKKCFCSFL